MRHDLRPPNARPRSGHAARAFTLIEVLVVMGIIVLLVALALPAFSFITGSRSTEAAGNQISGALGVARTQAIGLQKICGIMFLIEPTSDRTQIALVQETDRPVAPEADAGGIGVYLDLVPDSEFAKLPSGVGVQTVTNGIGVTANDRYLGFNTAGLASNATATSVTTKIGGVILFDGNGQLVAKTYALRSRLDAATPSRMGALLFYDVDATAADNASRTHTPVDYIPTGTAANAPVSQLGLVLFDGNTFVTRFQSATVPDPYGDARADLSNNPQAAETIEEAWLDENGSPTMINRYNGTLVRGE